MIVEHLLKADINTATSGDNTIIAAPSGTGQYIVIDHINLAPAGAVSIQIKDGSTSYGGLYSLASNQLFALDNVIQNEEGIITLSVNSAFVINLSGAVQVSGFIRYRIINL
jgi:hypothetical protein